jgi:hypothetical protein
MAAAVVDHIIILDFRFFRTITDDDVLVVVAIAVIGTVRKSADVKLRKGIMVVILILILILISQ